MQKRSAAAAGVFLAWLCGCTAVPINDVENPRGLEVKIGGLSTRIFHPGQGGRFTVRITNRTDGAVSLDGLNVKLQAQGEGKRPDSIDRKWGYGGLQGVLEAGNHLDLQVVPEPQEFPLGSLQPGRYQVRATVCDRFTSEPFQVRVEKIFLAPAR